jgi:hypothetical protein
MFRRVSPLRRSVATFGSGYKHFMRMNRRPQLLEPEYYPLSESSSDRACVGPVQPLPYLLGFGLDQSTSITVHGDNLTVNGPMRVAVWDGKDHDGKGFYYLRTGDQLNTVTRVATLVPHPTKTTDK